VTPGSAPEAVVLVVVPTVGTPTSRRANASAVHASGVPIGPPAPPAADCEPPNPNHDKTPSTTLVGDATTGGALTRLAVGEKLATADTDGAATGATAPVEPPESTAAAGRNPDTEFGVVPIDGAPPPLELPAVSALLALIAPDEVPPEIEAAPKCRLPDVRAEEPAGVDPTARPLVDPTGEAPDSVPPDAPVEPGADVLAPPEADTLDVGDPPDDVDPPDGAGVPAGAVVPADPVVVEELSDADDAADEPLSVPVDDDEPLDPAEPVVSAKANPGVDAIAAPTPSATASPATRPM
jgi:hypothetical protein